MKAVHIRLSILLCITLLAASCKLAVIVVEGGEVQSQGAGICVAGVICIVDVTDTSFSDTFTAIPHTDWYFEKWNAGDRFLCGGSTDSTCTLSFQGHQENKAVKDVVASSELFYLMPVFKPHQDIITVNGNEWLQPALFIGLSWDEINTVCPSGVCGDSAQLNGYDMTGWTWASVDDAKTLFNAYIGDDVLDSGTDFYRDSAGKIVESFFNDGWRPTHEGVVLDYIEKAWRVMLRDIKIEPDTPRYAGDGFVYVLYELNLAGNPDNAVEIEPGDVHTAAFSARVGGDIDDYEDGFLIGALFYR